ncbi:hypothetical protein YTPLAS72_08640 [Nitrospira sp.]|nr:hypothetical protein YTPLAS72_08640 [Nitrospira sp.]
MEREPAWNVYGLMGYSLAWATTNLSKSMLLPGHVAQIETITAMAYCPRAVMACCTDRNQLTPLLCGSD